MKFNHYFFTIVIIAANFLPLSSMPPGGPSSEGFELVQDYVTHDQSAKFGQELVAVYDRADDKGKKLIEQALEVYYLLVDDVRKKLTQDACDTLVEDISKKLTHNTMEIREYKLSSDEQGLRQLITENGADKADDIIGLIKKEGYKTDVMYMNDSMIGFLVRRQNRSDGSIFLVYWAFSKKELENGEDKKLLHQVIKTLVNGGVAKITKTVCPKSADFEREVSQLTALGFKAQAVFLSSGGALLESYELSGDELKQYQQKSANENMQFVQEEIPLAFDREKMATDGRYRVEGYWGSSEDPTKDMFQGKFPWPRAHEKPWKGKKEFLTRLKRIELRAEKYKYKDFLVRTQYKGLSPSRFQPERSVGSAEYQDAKNMIKWPAGYGEHYVGKYNVIPSREFYDYVMNYKFIYE